MLNGIYLISIILGVTLQNVFKKPYVKKASGKGAFIFNALLSASAMLFFVVTSKGMSFNYKILPYSLGFALAYASASVFAVLAISEGSLSLTSLFISYSLILPTLYGIIFLDDSLSIGFIVGMVLLSVSLFLINEKDGKVKITKKWLLYAFLSFVGNGMCSVVQKMQQTAFDGDYKNEFMIAALAVVTVITTAAALTKEKDFLSFCIAKGWYFAVLCGVINGIVNLLVMLLSGRMSVSVMFPLISAGGLVTTYLLARVVYKEKLSRLQMIGFALGTASIIFFNL